MKNRFNRIAAILVCVAVLTLSISAQAADYVIDHKGAHASINFKVKHLGYSWLTGRFNTFSGTFSYDENDIQVTQVNVEIDTASVDTNHAKRDKHLRSDDFLDVAKYKRATFVSTGIKSTDDGKTVLTGDLTLRGITRSIDMTVSAIGGGKDPWGGFRQGFEGTTWIALADFGITEDLGPSSRNVELFLFIEGVRK